MSIAVQLNVRQLKIVMKLFVMKKIVTRKRFAQIPLHALKKLMTVFVGIFKIARIFMNVKLFTTVTRLTQNLIMTLPATFK